MFGLALMLLAACGGSDDTESYIPPIPDKIIPSNLSLSISVEGADVDNAYGNGTGVVNFVATANDAVEYKFIFGVGTEVESTDGNAAHTFTKKETNTFRVYVYAYSKTGDYISLSEDVTVFVASELIFSDEFDTDGSPDDSKWTYDIGRGDWGWGNNESQYYTKRTNNVKIEGGILKITAQKEPYLGAQYTSTRMKTQDKFEFTYGIVEVRAKLPEGRGTWPAIWMLGSNITKVGWPECGEIDIMEHVGNNQGSVQSALHTPSSFGDTSNHGNQYISTVSSEFHVYKVNWTKDEMIFSVDGKQHYKYKPAVKNNSTWPFDASQFLILNVAMGGTFGGSIDPNFTESSMEIDYVRVYQ